MREIKFRAKSITTGEFVYSMTVSNGTIPRKENKYFFEVSPEKWVGVIPETISQFTGLQDKDGTDIYEGDILSEKWKCEVYKSDKTGAYMVKFLTNPCPALDPSRTLYDFMKQRKRAGTIERDGLIIGNIHEDKHLIDNTK